MKEGKISTREFTLMGMLVVIISLLYLSCVYADVIHLKNGGDLEGKIIEETEQTVKIKLVVGEVEIERARIKNIEKTPTEEDIYLQRVNELDENDIQGHYKLGLFCLENNLKEYARIEFEKANEIKLNNAETHFTLGEFCFENRLYNYALIQFERAVLLDSSFTERFEEKRKEVYEASARLKYNSAVKYWNAGSYSQALTCCKTIESKYPNSQVVEKARRLIPKCKAGIERVKQKEIERKRRIKYHCKYCNGTGICPACKGKKWVKCSVCKGTGFEIIAVHKKRCIRCYGTGKTPRTKKNPIVKKCPYCKGKGYVMIEEKKRCHSCKKHQNRKTRTGYVRCGDPNGIYPKWRPQR
ncbi:MAG: hypothetical protein KAX15_05570, partial [Candidatus Omnitrophica bacterium]|nr:hypothetical protein [Candidatus Omnitrophota bacterium]